MGAIIYAARTTDGQQPAVRRMAEAASQTFLMGTPVEYLSASSGVAAWDGTTYTGLILGFCMEPASNLTTAGVAKTLTYGSVPNQSSAVKIPRGAPLNDGRINVLLAKGETIFYGLFSTTAAATDIGVSYGLTKDSDNLWYVDKAKTTTSGGGSTNQAVVRIVALDPNNTKGVFFKVLAAASQEII